MNKPLFSQLLNGAAIHVFSICEEFAFLFRNNVNAFGAILTTRFGRSNNVGFYAIMGAIDFCITAKLYFARKVGDIGVTR
jgi:hypothetical protein